VLDIRNATINHTKKIIGQHDEIFDILAIDKTHFFLGSTDGLFKVTKE
jgi:hypothetical protein